MLSAKQLRQTTNRLGLRGEGRAVEFLRYRGFKIIARNIRFKLREVDIIAHDNKSDELVFVEVKTRSNEKFGWAGQAVSVRKIQTMTIVAEKFLRELGLTKPYRFDIICVVGEKVEHFENISWGL